MFKGIIALFTSGAIFNPMVLLGIVVGIVFEIKMDYAQIMMHAYKNYHFYVLALLLAAVYNFAFKKVYYGSNQKGLDWGVMVGNIIFSAFKFVFSSALTIALVEMLAF